MNPREIRKAWGCLSVLLLAAGCVPEEQEVLEPEAQEAVVDAMSGARAPEVPGFELAPYVGHAHRKRTVTREQLENSYKNRIDIKFREGSGVRARLGALAVEGPSGPARATSQELAAVLALLGGARRHMAVPLHTLPEETLAQWKAEGERASGRALPELALWQHLYVELDSDEAFARLIDGLNALEVVELAAPSALPEPPPDMNGEAAQAFNAAVRAQDRHPWPSGDTSWQQRRVTVERPSSHGLTPPSPEWQLSAMAAPSYVSWQHYRGAAPVGIDIDYLQSAYWNAHGGNWGYTDCEYTWNQAHGELGIIASSSVLVSGTPSSAVDPSGHHGTAVVGVLSSAHNGLGTSGLVPNSAVRLSTEYPTSGYNRPASIVNAAAQFWKGAVIILEMQASSSASCGNLHGYVPAEWNPAVKDAVRTATANGRIVIAAAGNGACNLDDPYFGGEFNPADSSRDSGAIIVGAAESSTRNRASFSTYGSRVDVQSEGDWKVTTTGYGDLYSAEGLNWYYTSTFSGTSSATPIVSGAALALSSVLWQYHGSIYSPHEMRDLLRRDGTPQGTGGHIGPRPDLRKQIVHMHNRHLQMHSADFDGDGRADTTMWRPSDGKWYIRSATGAITVVHWGTQGDIPTPANVTGDRRAELIVFRPSNGTWYVRRWDGTSYAVRWGQSSDIPVPLDYDGDGFAELVVLRPGNVEPSGASTWYIRYANGSHQAVAWGAAADTPLSRDFDGDGRDDLAVFRASSGTWYIRHANGTQRSLSFGLWGDIPLAYKAGGRWNLATWSPVSGVFTQRDLVSGAVSSTLWGIAGDLPRFADTDGNGWDERIIYRPSNGTWYIHERGQIFTWGDVGDIAIAR
jgi:hypothetical protein